MRENKQNALGRRLIGIGFSMMVITALLIAALIWGGMSTENVILVMLLNVISHVVLFYMHVRCEEVRRKAVLLVLIINIIALCCGFMFGFWKKGGDLRQHVLRETQCITREEWDTGDYAEQDGKTPVIELSNTATAITLTWNEVAEAEGYCIYRKDGAAGEYHLLLMLMDSTVTTYTDISALPASNYTYGVCAFTGKELSNCVISEITSAIWRPVIQAETVNEGIRISWNHIAGVEGYYIYRKEADGKYSKISTILSEEEIDYIDTTAVFGTEYTYGIRAYIGEETSRLATNVITAVLEEPVVQVSTFDGGVQVEWQHVDMAEGYIVYRKLEGEKFKAITTIEDSAVTAYFDTEPVLGEKNLYTVRAYRGKYKSTYTGVEIQVPVTNEQ